MTCSNFFATPSERSLHTMAMPSMFSRTTGSVSLTSKSLPCINIDTASFMKLGTIFVAFFISSIALCAKLNALYPSPLTCAKLARKESGH